jgi:hypothetical protein
MPNKIFLEQTYPDGSTSIGVIVDAPVPRKGYERFLPPGVKVGLAGWERAHQVGPGFGTESKRNILYAPKEFNQVYQNRAIENDIRTLYKEKLPDVEIRVMTDARPYPNTLILKEITYSVTLVKGGVAEKYYEVTLEIENIVRKPKIIVDPKKVVIGPAYLKREQYVRIPVRRIPRPPGKRLRTKAAGAILATALNAGSADAKAPTATTDRATEIAIVAKQEPALYAPDRALNRGITSTIPATTDKVMPIITEQKNARAGEVEVGRVSIKYERVGNTVKTEFTRLDLSGFNSGKTSRLSRAFENPIVSGLAQTGGSFALNKLMDYGIDKLKSYYISRIELAKVTLEKEFPSEDVLRSANDVDEKLQTIAVIMENRKPFDFTDLPSIKANINYLTPAFDFENQLIDLAVWLTKQALELAPIRKDIEFRAKMLTDVANNILKALEIIVYTSGVGIAYMQTLVLWDWYTVLTELGAKMSSLSSNIYLKIQEYENMSIHEEVIKVSDLLNEVRPFYLEYANGLEFK